MLVFAIPFVRTAAQTYLGDYTGHSVTGKTITVRASEASLRLAFYPDILRLDFLPSSAAVPDSSFAVIRDSTESVSFSSAESDSTIEFFSSSMRVLFQKYPLRASIYDPAGNFLLEEPATGGLASDGLQRTAHFVLGSFEHFYGTGERGIGLDLRGHAFDSYNTQVYGYGSALGTMNINIALLVSSRGYALFFDNTYPGRFDLGSSDPSRFSYRAAGGELTVYVIAGNTVAEQLERYTWLTGRQPLPPRWAFGYLQSKFGYQNESEARAAVQTMREKNIPCDAIVIDAYWFNQMGDLSWNSAAWPNPSGMMQDFLNDGIKTILITQTYFTEFSANYSEAVAGNFLATTTSGQPYLLPNWWSCNCNATLLDITSQPAREWFWSKHPPLFGAGIAGIWTDLGEPERHPSDMMHARGSTAKIHNIYNLLWAETIFGGFNELRSNQRLFNLTRSGFAGIQRYGVSTWSGDVAKTFNALSIQIPMLLNMGMSGIGYHNTDIGGFCCGFTTPELYVRWMQFGCFSPITRAHGAGPSVGGQDTEPWAFGSAAEQIVRKFLQLRYQLLPYNYSLARQNHERGIPLARPLFFDFPNNGALANSNQSYLWGEAFLVSPVVETEQTSKSVYLPDGNWFYYWDDRAYAGNQTVVVSTPLAIMPLFVKGGSIIPRLPVMEYSNERPLDTLILSIYPSPFGEARFSLYEDDGETLEYQTGSFAVTELLQTFMMTTDSSYFLLVSIGPTAGSYSGKPERRVYLGDIHGILAPPTGISNNGLALAERPSYEDLRGGRDGYFYDQARSIVFFQIDTNPDSSYDVIVENAVLSHRESGDPVPLVFRLEQNYPNPFNRSTTIPFTVHRSLFATLKVFDVLGREVATLVREALEPGSHVATWDGGGKPSGVYFYRLQAGEFVETKKLLLLR